MLELICPNCKNKLKGLNCGFCEMDFPVVNGIPHLLPKHISDFKKKEIAFHEKEFKKERHSYEYVTENFTSDTWSLMRFMEFVAPLPFSANILELGAGNAQYGITLKRKGYKNVISSDIMDAGLVDAKNYANSHNLNLENSLYVFDAENIPFEDETFDCVFLAAAFHHFEAPRRVMREIERVLKKDGLAVIALEPNRWYFNVVRPLAKFFKLRMIQKEGASSIADEETRGFTLKELTDLCETSRLKPQNAQRIWYLTGFLYYFEDFSERVLKRKAKIPFFLRKFSARIDKIMEKAPLVNNFSFHNTVCLKKM